MLLAIQILATFSMLLDVLTSNEPKIIAFVMAGILITFIWLWPLPGLVIMLSAGIVGALILLGLRK